MKRRFIYYLLPLLTMLTMPGILASCSREEMDREQGNSPNAQNGEIRFEMGFASMDVASQKDPQTRVATDTKFKSTWEDGDEIGIFAVEHGKELANSGNLFHNVKLTYSSANGGKWTATEPMIWPKDGTELDFYAYYPYDESLVNPSELQISLPMDQSAVTDKGQPVYNRNDVLWCKNTTGIGKNGGAVSLSFSHMLAMVQVKVSSSMLGGYPPEALDVWLDGAHLRGSMNIRLGNVTVKNSNKGIKMYACPTDDGKGTYAYRALVMPYVIIPETLFRFQYNGTDILTSPPITNSLILKSGQVETFDMTFPFTSVTVSSSARLADLIPDDKLGTVTHLKVLGEMTAADFKTIRDDMPSITSLDLGGATVEGNIIPDEALWRKLSLTEFVFPRGVTTIGGSAFKYCAGLSGDLTIPNSVTTIGDQAFSECRGFSGNLTIPNGVTTIGEYAFWYCRGLTGNLKIPNSVTTIGDNAFYYCDGFSGSLTIPNSVTTIGKQAFSYCSGLTGNLTIPNSVTTIGESAFSSCSNLSGSLTISESVTVISSVTFYGCSKLSGNLKIPNRVTVIGQSAFYGCSGFSGSLTIPDSVTVIGNFAFEGCNNLSGNLTIPNSVKSIGGAAFKGCSGFSGSLTIPNSVTTIYAFAFEGCSNITSIYCYIENPDITYYQGIFRDVPNTTPVYVPAGTLELYRAKEPWSSFKNIQEMQP